MNTSNPYGNTPLGRAVEKTLNKTRYSLAEIERLPTLCVGQADDLKMEDESWRLWLSRCGIEDGEPYPNKVTIEEYIDGKWQETEQYQAV